MQSAFVLSFLALLLVGGLCSVMPAWPRSPFHVMRREGDSCEVCQSRPSYISFDDFQNVSAGRAACRTFQPFIDCVIGNSECDSYELYKVDHISAVCSDIEGMVAVSQCFGGEEGSLRVWYACNTRRINASDEDSSEFTEQGDEREIWCRAYSTNFMCAVDVAFQCSHSAGQLLNRIRELRVAAKGCA